MEIMIMKLNNEYGMVEVISYNPRDVYHWFWTKVWNSEVKLWIKMELISKLMWIIYIWYQPQLYKEGRMVSAYFELGSLWFGENLGRNRQLWADDLETSIPTPGLIYLNAKAEVQMLGLCLSLFPPLTGWLAVCQQPFIFFLIGSLAQVSDSRSDVGVKEKRKNLIKDELEKMTRSGDRSCLMHRH